MEKIAEQRTRSTTAAAAMVSSIVAQTLLSKVEEVGIDDSQQALGELLDQAVHEGVEVALRTLAERYADGVLGAAHYQRSAGRSGLRSGHRSWKARTALGALNVSVVKSRAGALVPPFLRDARGFANGIVQLGRDLWLRGLSTRDVSAVAEEALGGAASHTTVATWVQEAQEEVLRWLNRPVGAFGTEYLFLDGIYVSVKRQTSCKEVVLVAMGVDEAGHKQILGVMNAGSESMDSWTTFLARLRGRGLDTSKLRLVISDGNDGVIAAINKELGEVVRQRCTVHKVRNIVGKCPRDLKATIPAEASKIWYAPNKAEARQRADDFITKYEETHPALTAIIKDDFEATLRFYDLDAKIWRSTCSTNVLERANRELKRKFSTTGPLNGEEAATRVAGLLCMELNKEWQGKIVNGFKKNPRRRPRATS